MLAMVAGIGRKILPVALQGQFHSGRVYRPSRRIRPVLGTPSVAGS